MKTKEVTIYVSDSGLRELSESFDRGNIMSNLEYSHVEYVRFKHKVTMNVPLDPKVEITESEFDEAWKNIEIDYNDSTRDVFLKMKQKLFSK